MLPMTAPLNELALRKVVHNEMEVAKGLSARTAIAQARGVDDLQSTIALWPEFVGAIENLALATPIGCNYKSVVRRIRSIFVRSAGPNGQCWPSPGVPRETLAEAILERGSRKGPCRNNGALNSHNWR